MSRAVPVFARSRMTVHVLLAACGLTAPFGGLLAQDAKAPADSGQLESITVTAERRAENIKEVPISISTLRGETLDVLNTSGLDVRLLSSRVPSLNIESSFGRAFPRFYIRGLGNTDFDLNASQPVSLVYDDIVQENPILKGFPIFDVAQVEVLRGPQGTLFGRNAPAGVVKFDSNRPEFDRAALNFNVAGATYGTFNFDGALNIPLASDSALRIAALYQRRNDYVENLYPGPTSKLEGYDDRALRVQWLYEPIKSISLLFNVHGRDLDGSARVFRANIFKPGTNDFADGFDPSKVTQDGVNEQHVRNTGGSARLRFDVGGNVAISSITGFEHVTSYSRGDIDGGFGAVFLPNSGPGFIPFSAESADGLPKHRQFTQEIRAESIKSDSFGWLAGLYYFNERFTIDSFNYDSLGGNVQNGYAVQRQTNNAYAAFGSVNFGLSDSLKIRAGLRYTKDKKDFEVDRLQPPPFSAPFVGRLDRKTDASETTGDLSGTLALNESNNLYARIARGFRAPSIQGRLLFPSGATPDDYVTVADTETITSVELGYKAELANRRVRFGFNVFSYQVDNQQLTAVGGGQNFNRLINADKVEGRGFELDVQARPAEHLRVSGGLSYNKTEIKDPSLFVAPCGNGCTVTDPAGPGGTVSIDGNPLPQAPKWVFNTTLRYGFPLGNGEIFVFTDWAYRGGVNFFLYEAKEYRGKPLLEGGLRVGYTWYDGQYEIAAYGRNITNQVRAVGGIDFNNLTGFINEPRIFGVQFKAQL